MPPRHCITQHIHPKTCLEPFRNLVYRLNDTSVSNVSPVTCIVSDAGMSFTLQVAKELEIPDLFFHTISLCSFACFMHYPHLIERGLVPLKDESCFTNGYMDTQIDWIPGIENILFRDLPSFVRTTDPNDAILNYVLREVKRSYEATAWIFNTFDELEIEVLDAFKSQLSLPPIYTIGPLHNLDNQIPQHGLQSIGSNLWKEDTKCIKWLDSKEPNSVVYVNFGSIAVTTTQQLVEFAWGLANTKHPFSGLSDLICWCPQEYVLNHPSIAGFLTHCGWNSTLESLSSGVPMICWPSFGDQQTNCSYSCNSWGVGMEIDNDVKRNEVEKLMKNRAMEWKKKAEEATSPGGSSYANVDEIINKFISSVK
ncbi:hypothetical protein MKW92_036150 [Papaver armeniacum]|nr:hypothetical protein MKW92_036150 [Papaver armeniacum]